MLPNHFKKSDWKPYVKRLSQLNGRLYATWSSYYNGVLDRMLDRLFAARFDELT
nr:hypothetical protein P5640_22645 [Bacillus subtilis]